MVAVCATVTVQAQHKKHEIRKTFTSTTVSIFTNYSAGTIDYETRSGQITGSTGGLHAGIGVSEAFYLRVFPPNTFISIGLKYYMATTHIAAHTTVYGFAPSSVDEATMNHAFIAVPIQAGKTIVLPGNKVAVNVFGGVSVGMAGVGAATTHQTIEKSYDDNEQISWAGPDFPDLKPYQTYAALEAGGTVAPAPDIPGLSFGLTATYDLTQTPYYDWHGYFINDARGITEGYKYSVSSRYLHIALSANYTFGRRMKAGLFKP